MDFFYIKTINSSNSKRKIIITRDRIIIYIYKYDTVVNKILLFTKKTILDKLKEK